MDLNKFKTSMNKINVIITLFLFFFTCGALLFNSIFNNVIISKYCSQIEKQDTLSKINQLKKIINYQVNNINSVVKDYAIWDDVYYKIQEDTIDTEWFTINYPDWLTKQLDIDLILIANKNKEIISKHGLKDDANIILNNNRISTLFTVNSYNDDKCFSGFIQYDGSIYLIGACPIFKTTT